VADPLALSRGTVRPVRGLELKKHDVLQWPQRAGFDAARGAKADPGQH
jgi:hypothetical protein